jgi:hypothetical protein
MDKWFAIHTSVNDFEQALLGLPISEGMLRASRKG